MSEFENVLSEYKEQTKPMCEALDCLDLLDDFLVDIELSRAKYHHFYQAGQQSQQAKIDELEFNLSSTVNNFDNSCKTIDIHQKFLDDADVDNKFLTDKIDELQKRIDDASNKIDFWVGGKNGDAIHVAKSIGNILKGNKDEN